MNMETGPGTIEVGCQVEVVLRDRAGEAEHLTAIIVTDEAADYAHGYLGEGTPLAQALLGEKAGTTIPYLKGDIYSIEIIAVTKPAVQVDGEAARKRQASMQEAIRQVENTNAIVFASSFSGKWGDYDPDSIPKDTQPGSSEEECRKNKPKS